MNLNLWERAFMYVICGVHSHCVCCMSVCRIAMSVQRLVDSVFAFIPRIVFFFNINPIKGFVLVLMWFYLIRSLTCDVCVYKHPLADHGLNVNWQCALIGEHVRERFMTTGRLRSLHTLVVSTKSTWWNEEDRDSHLEKYMLCFNKESLEE